MLSLGGGFTDADAVLARTGTRISARVHSPKGELEQNIAIAGCDPALSLLQGAVPGLAGRCFWVNCGSGRALELLAGDWVHVAGLHYSGPDGRENLRQIERFDRAGRWQVLHFTRWEQGWMLRAGARQKFRGTGDLGSGKICLANREPGSGTRNWLDGQLAQIGISSNQIRGYGQEHASHWECAMALVEGKADVAVGPRAVAAVFGLEFLPVSEVAFDLVIPRPLLDHPRIQAILQRVRSRGFQREIATLSGYWANEAGTQLERSRR
jgi:molybdate-binding protein